MSHGAFLNWIVFLLACYIFSPWIVIPLFIVYHIIATITVIVIAHFSYDDEADKKGSKT